MWRGPPGARGAESHLGFFPSLLTHHEGLKKETSYQVPEVARHLQIFVEQVIQFALLPAQKQGNPRGPVDQEHTSQEGDNLRNEEGTQSAEYGFHPKPSIE
jgi:hypothetical protein